MIQKRLESLAKTNENVIRVAAKTYVGTQNNILVIVTQTEAIGG